MQTILKSHNLNIEEDSDYESAFTKQSTEHHCCSTHVSNLLNLSENDIESETEFNDEEDVDTMFIEEMFNKDYDKNFVSNRVLALLREEASHFKDLTLVDCKKIEDRLYYRDRKYVSNYHAFKLRLLKLHHDSFVEDHQDRINTYELLSRNYY